MNFQSHRVMNGFGPHTSRVQVLPVLEWKIGFAGFVDGVCVRVSIDLTYHQSGVDQHP